MCNKRCGNETEFVGPAEVYNEASGTFSVTGSLNAGRDAHAAALLPMGEVLVAGGKGAAGYLASAELYNPTTNTPAGLLSINITPASPYVPTGSTLNLVANGTFTGNVTEALAAAVWTSSNTNVVTVTNDSTNRGHAYGIANGTATITACTGSICGSTVITVQPHSSLIIGSDPTDTARSTFEQYNESGALINTGNLAIPRAYHTATVLNNNRIFVAGGTDDDTSWQIFDPDGDVLSSGTLQDGRILSAATLLNNGNVFIAGGTASPGTWEIYTPTGALVSSGSLNGSRSAGLSAVTLANGNVWISGSSFTNGDACTWEIHNPDGSLVSSGSLNSCFGGAQVQVLGNGNVILIGGGNSPGTYEIHSQSGALVSTGSLLSAFNGGESSALLQAGNVFVFGSCLESNPPELPDTNGCGTQGSPSTWETITANGSLVATGSLEDQRDTAGAVVLSNGNIFITGGNLVPSAWEIRSGSDGSLVSQGSLFDTRYGGHTLTHF